jgi:hypothetical protein
MRNGGSRETYLRETTLLSLNPRKIACYIPYSRQVLPKRRNTVRMDLKLTIEEYSQWKMYYNMEGLQEQIGRITEIEIVP